MNELIRLKGDWKLPVKCTAPPKMRPHRYVSAGSLRDETQDWRLKRKSFAPEVLARAMLLPAIAVPQHRMMPRRAPTEAGLKRKLVPVTMGEAGAHRRRTLEELK